MLSPQNWKMLTRYFECRGSRTLVTDPVQRKCFGIIEWTLELFACGHRRMLVELLAAGANFGNIH